MSIRLRRLQAEYERVTQLFARHGHIRIAETFGNPPERYIIEYRIRGLVEDQGEIKERVIHRAQIVLGRNYPNELPRCNMLTPVFHPNIDHLRICTEDIGSVGKTIDQVITFIGEMIAFQAYNVKSPLNGDAARWTMENLDRLPLEKIDLVPAGIVRPPTKSQTTEPLSPSSQNMNATNDVPAPLGLPQSQPMTAVAVRCTNCGQEGQDVRLESCAGGHRVCVDCFLDCGSCGKAICVLCSVGNCANCRSLVCADCRTACDVSGHQVCSVCSMTCTLCTRRVCVLCEVQNCAACRGLVCPSCIVTCAGCQRSYCRGHVFACQVCDGMRCSDCMLGCDLCDKPSCVEHVDSRGICLRCKDSGTSSLRGGEDQIHTYTGDFILVPEKDEITLAPDTSAEKDWFTLGYDE